MQLGHYINLLSMDLEPKTARPLKYCLVLIIEMFKVHKFTKILQTTKSFVNVNIMKTLQIQCKLRFKHRIKKTKKYPHF